jgi:hypothetical protein
MFDIATGKEELPRNYLCLVLKQLYSVRTNSCMNCTRFEKIVKQKKSTGQNQAVLNPCHRFSRKGLLHQVIGKFCKGFYISGCKGLLQVVIPYDYQVIRLWNYQVIRLSVHHNKARFRGPLSSVHYHLSVIPRSAASHNSA